MADNVLGLHWRARSMPEQICESMNRKGGSRILISWRRVLLDDVLAAVDSHVARHVFGTSHLNLVWQHLTPELIKITSLALKVSLPPKLESSLPTVLRILSISTSSHISGVGSSSSVDRIDSSSQTLMARYAS